MLLGKQIVKNKYVANVKKLRNSTFKPPKIGLSIIGI